MMTNILIAEDDPMMSHLYQQVFNKEGFAVEMTANGQEALDRARSQPFDLILLDIMMPKLNGLDALTQLKADPQLASIPVAILTNLASPQDADTALAKGAIRYIVKSEQDATAVVDIVREILANQPS